MLQLWSEHGDFLFRSSVCFFVLRVSTRKKTRLFSRPLQYNRIKNGWKQNEPNLSRSLNTKCEKHEIWPKKKTKTKKKLRKIVLFFSFRETWIIIVRHRAELKCQRIDIDLFFGILDLSWFAKCSLKEMKNGIHYLLHFGDKEYSIFVTFYGKWFHCRNWILMFLC